MFKELQLADWAGIVAVAAFFATAAVFVAVVVGALRMPRRKVLHDAALPLEKETRK